MSTKDKNIKSYSVKDVAKLSGTSLGTVSRVINGAGSVSAKTRAKVEQAIAELDYAPNLGARQIRSGRSGLIGILLPSLRVPFFGILAHALEQVLFTKGYHSLICNTEENEDNERRYVSTLIGQKVDGIIAAAVVTTNNYVRFNEKNIPIVAVDRSPYDHDENLISVDHHTGGYLMAEHLLTLGHRDIAIVGAPTHSSPIMKRLSGIKAALEQAGLKPMEIALAEEHSFEVCAELAKNVLKNSRPSAIIGTTDIAAIGTIHAGHQLGLNLPSDLSIVGFDNIPQSAHIFPTLTTVDQPVTRLGEQAALALLHRIDPERFDQPPVRDLPLKIIERNSTASFQGKSCHN